MSLAMSNSKKFEIGVEVDKNLDSYPFTPILPLVVVLANPVNVTALTKLLSQALVCYCD